MSAWKIRALTIAIAVIIVLYVIFSLDRVDTLTVSANKNDSVFSSYRLGSRSIIGVKINKRMLRYKFIYMNKDKLNLAGTMKTKSTEYAVVSERTGVRIYTSLGEIEALYKPEGKEEHIISCCLGDINNDSEDELLIVTGTGDTFYGNKLAILAYDSGFKKLFEKAYKEFNPWKVQTADVDGDGILDISLGVFKESPFHQVVDRRPFIFYWYKGDLVPKWRGSRLSRPFEDYVFSDLDKDGMAEIVAAEFINDNKMLLSAYKWRGFGFEGMAESSTYEKIEGLKIHSIEDGTVYACISKNSRTVNATLIYSSNTLVEKGN